MLLKLAENELDEKETGFLDDHICDCRKCRDLVEEYRELSRLLAGDRIPEPSAAEWRFLMVRTRTRLRGKIRVWDRPQILPAWARVAAIAAAAVVTLVILWRTGIVDVGRLAHITGSTDRNAERIAGSGQRYTAREETIPSGTKKPVESAPAGEGVVFEKEGLVSNARFAELDSTSLDLAGLTNDELYELGELSTCVSATRDYDLLLVDLSQEEQAAILSKLESSSSM